MNNNVQQLSSEDWSSKIDRVFLPDANDYLRKYYFNRYFLVTEKVVRPHFRNESMHYMEGGYNCPPMIIDAACGDGAGSAFLAEQFPGWNVLGYDIDEDIIKYANREYASKYPNLIFTAKNIVDINARACDVFVCLETIEHVERDVMDAFLANVAEQLNPGGKFVVSTPRLRPRETTVKRPGHINELYYQEFKSILGMHFPMLEFYSLDRYGNVVPDSTDANLMIAVCSKFPETKVF